MTILSTNKHTIQLEKDANKTYAAYFDSIVKHNDKHKNFETKYKKVKHKNEETQLKREKNLKLSSIRYPLRA